MTSYFYLIYLYLTIVMIYYLSERAFKVWDLNFFSCFKWEPFKFQNGAICSQREKLFILSSRQTQEYYIYILLNDEEHWKITSSILPRRSQGYNYLSDTQQHSQSDIVVLSLKPYFPHSPPYSDIISPSTCNWNNRGFWCDPAATFERGEDQYTENITVLSPVT